MTILAVMTDHTNTVWSVPGVIANSGFPQYYSTAYATDTYDKLLNRCAIVLSPGTSEPILDLGAEYDEFWIHFTLDYSDTAVTAGLSLLDMYDASGNLQIGVVENATGPILDVRKSTDGTTYGTTFAGTITSSAASRVAWDVQVKIGAAGYVHVYNGDTLIYSFVGDTSTNGADAIQYIRFTGGRNITKYLSEVVAADEETVGWRVSSLAPETGTQDFSDWTGDYSTVDDFDGTAQDSAYANSSDATSSYVVDDLDASVSSLVVKGVVSCARCLVTAGATTPNIDLGLSIGTTFYTGGTKTIGAGAGELPAQAIFDTNPATASQFTQTDVNNLQLALRAKT